MMRVKMNNVEFLFKTAISRISCMVEIIKRFICDSSLKGYHLFGVPVGERGQERLLSNTYYPKFINLIGERCS